MSLFVEINIPVTHTAFINRNNKNFKKIYEVMYTSVNCYEMFSNIIFYNISNYFQKMYDCIII